MYAEIFLFVLAFSSFFVSLFFGLNGCFSYNFLEYQSAIQLSNFDHFMFWLLIGLINGITNITTMYDIINIRIKEEILIQGLSETFYQIILFLVTLNYGTGRYFFQYILGFLVLVKLLIICFELRRPYLASNYSLGYFLYLPYSLWLTYQILIYMDIISKYIINYLV